MAKFLSDTWFEQVTQLTAQAGDLQLPLAVQNLTINLHITGDVENSHLYFAQGTLHKGTLETAQTSLQLSEELLRKIFFERDVKAAMTGVMFGKIKIQGDMGQLMALQMLNASPQHKALFKQILEISE
ncbi:MAG: SCP2 sterol-binding domain-containing protein [Acinetobacter sp.]|nr:SCP2 sterol-binding domain-containing protein [Acinetobacter sp.]